MAQSQFWSSTGRSKRSARQLAICCEDVHVRAIFFFFSHVPPRWLIAQAGTWLGWSLCFVVVSQLDPFSGDLCCPPHPPPPLGGFSRTCVATPNRRGLLYKKNMQVELSDDLFSLSASLSTIFPLHDQGLSLHVRVKREQRYARGVSVQPAATARLHLATPIHFSPALPHHT